VVLHRRLLLAFGVVLLTGCHADITYRLDFHADQTASVTMREKLDDQFFNMAVHEAKGGDPFGLEAAKSHGWSVDKVVDSEDNHVITMTRTLPVNDFQQALNDNPTRTPIT
jgi:hypothetical protein